MTREHPAPRAPGGRSNPIRWLLAALGLLCVGLAFVGVFVPGLPTTIFLMAASYLFVRSCPWLEERLVRSKWFRPYLPYLDRAAPLPRRARITALALMWIAVGVSSVSLAAGGALDTLMATLLLSAALAGTVVILLIRRPPRSERTGGV